MRVDKAAVEPKVTDAIKKVSIAKKTGQPAMLTISEFVDVVFVLAGIPYQKIADALKMNRIKLFNLRRGHNKPTKQLAFQVYDLQVLPVRVILSDVFKSEEEFIENYEIYANLDVSQFNLSESSDDSVSASE